MWAVGQKIDRPSSGKGGLIDKVLWFRDFLRCLSDVIFFPGWGEQEQNMSSGICAKCAKPFAAGSILNALDKRWHPECFVCAGCKHQLANQSFHCKDEVPYCVNCWKEKFQPRCAVGFSGFFCYAKIEIFFFTNWNLRIHTELRCDNWSIGAICAIRWQGLSQGVLQVQSMSNSP